MNNDELKAIGCTSYSSQILHNGLPHNLRIDLGGRDIAVSQEFLDGRNVHPLIY